MDIRSCQTGTDSFIYQHFPDANHIRILELLPGSQTDGICCKITVVPFAGSENTYDAISYAWGDPNDLTQITCNGQVLSVTVSLADALRRIRDPRVSNRLWADAICLNQNDEVEKGHQVKRMGKIYENARMVVVWLGHDPSGIAEDGFNLIRETNHYLDQQFEKYGGSGFPRLQTPYPISNDKLRWAKVQTLVHLPWFSRVWVIQEAGLGKSCMLLWGGEELNIAELMEVSAWVAFRVDVHNLTGYTGLGTVCGTFYDIHCTYENVHTWRSTMPFIQLLGTKRLRGTPLFLDLLQASRISLASNPRDYVYAFLGNPLARRIDGELMIMPDYSKTVDDLYFDVACALLKQHRERSFVLSSVMYRTTEDFETRNTPSWVPQWNQGYQHYSIATPRHWYKSGGIDMKFCFQVKTDHKARLLEAEGFVFDSLTWTSQPINIKNLDTNPDHWEEFSRSSAEPFIDVLRKEVEGASGCATDQVDGQEDTFSLTMVQNYALRESQDDISFHGDNYAAYLGAVRSAVAGDSGYNESPIAISGNGSKGNAHDYEGQLVMCHERRLAWTKRGRLCLVPLCARLDDVCCLFPGLSVPFILRPAGDGKHYLVGDCYIHGVMNGELMDGLKNGTFREQTITLV
jgi:hypothetical protein